MARNPIQSAVQSERFRRLAAFRRALLFLPLTVLMRFVARRAFFVARVLPVAAMRFFVARTALGMLLLLRLVARRLDSAERTAKFFNLALVGKLLALGDFNQFKNFIELVNHVLERFRNFRGMGHGLADG
jgi:hypothetical protein